MAVVKVSLDIKDLRSAHSLWVEANTCFVPSRSGKTENKHCTIDWWRGILEVPTSMHSGCTLRDGNTATERDFRGGACVKGKKSKN